MKPNMKLGRESSKGAPSTDLLVCFPSRAYLALMPPKPICSPARPPQTEPTTRRHHHHHHHHHHGHHPLKKSATRTRGGSGGKASPLLWAKNKQMGGEITEPTSPKVTCAGQIKVRHSSNRNGSSSNTNSSSKNWQSVMEEIERIHKSKHKKRSSISLSSSSSWIESIGIKKDVMQFLTCLRNIRLDFRCFGAFPQSDIVTDDDEEEAAEEDDDDEAEEVGDDDHEEEEYSETRPRRTRSESDDDHESSRAVFSRWFMVLKENQESDVLFKEESKHEQENEEEGGSAPSIPPPNALLLMRCRSAPAKSWIQRRRHQDQEHKDEEGEEGEEGRGQETKAEVVIKKKGKNLRDLMDEENRTTSACNKKDNLLVMTYNTDLYKISTDIAKETWVVGGIKNILTRSRSWKS